MESNKSSLISVKFKSNVETRPRNLIHPRTLEKKGIRSSPCHDPTIPSRTKTSPTMSDHHVDIDNTTRWDTTQTLRTGAKLTTHLALQGVAAPRRVTGTDGASDEDPVASERIAVSLELLPSRHRRRSPSIQKDRGVGEGTENDGRGMQIWSSDFGERPLRITIRETPIFCAKFRYHNN